ncbi:MAG: nickel pincer cofactor biosynthesis protein LarB [Pirellulaceae bacterium]|nr:nickel pincer cofactor biosynthesis protein LarB [Pirellulaceae bacterium]
MGLGCVNLPLPRKSKPVTDARIDQLKQQWLPELEAGRLSWSELAERLLQNQAQAGADYHADTDRQRRCGLGEVIYGPGKSAGLIETIALKLLNSGQAEILVTRVEADVAAQVTRRLPYSRYDLLGRTLRLRRTEFPQLHTDLPASGSTASKPATLEVAVVCAGSTDLPVAREALETLSWMGVPAFSIVDVGVAGPYRLLGHIERLRRVVAVVVIAGMEGALASVAGGLLACPIIAVPTSVGYGANLQGVTTLLSMLSSCAAGVTVVNIDAGFKGGYIAGLIARQIQAREL